MGESPGGRGSVVMVFVSCSCDSGNSGDSLQAFLGGVGIFYADVFGRSVGEWR